MYVGQCLMCEHTRLSVVMREDDGTPGGVLVTLLLGEEDRACVAMPWFQAREMGVHLIEVASHVERGAQRRLIDEVMTREEHPGRQ